MKGMLAGGSAPGGGFPGSRSPCDGVDAVEVVEDAESSSYCEVDEEGDEGDEKGTVEFLFAEGFAQKAREKEQKITQRCFRRFLTH